MSPDPDAGAGEDFFAAIGADPVEANLRAMGSPDEFDRGWIVEQLAATEVRAPLRPDATQRHQDAAFRGEWPEHERLRDITAPALVVHGSADRVLPVRHAVSLGEGVRDSEVRVIDGMGHLPTRAEWVVVADLVIGFLTR